MRNEPNPAYLVYAADEVADCATRTHEQSGMFAALRAQAWREQGLPADHSELARRLGLTPKYFAKHAPIVLKQFREVDGRLVLPEQEEQRARQSEKREKNRLAAETRWERERHASALRSESARNAVGDANEVRTQCLAVAVAVAGNSTTTPGVSSLREVLPESDRDAFDKLLTGTKDPESVAAEIRTLMAESGASPEQIGQAIRDLVVNGEQYRALRFRRYVDIVRKAESAPSTAPAGMSAFDGELYDLIGRIGLARPATAEQKKERVRYYVREGGCSAEVGALLEDMIDAGLEKQFANATAFDRNNHIKMVAQWRAKKVAA